MTDNTCNGWTNYATWRVSLWFGDSFAAMAEDGIYVTAEICRCDVEETVYDMIGRDSTTAGFLWDMLDLNAVDWDAIAAHHVTEEEAA